MKNYLILMSMLICLEGCTFVAEKEVKEPILVTNIQSLNELELQVAQDPNNLELKFNLIRQREEFLNKMLVEADRKRNNDLFEEAIKLYERVLKIEPSSIAASGKSLCEMGLRHKKILKDAEVLIGNSEFSRAGVKIRNVLIENPDQRQAKEMLLASEKMRIKDEALLFPVLDLAIDQKITLEFKEAQLVDVFSVISELASINFIFDKDVDKEMKVSIFVQKVSIEDALQLLLSSNVLAKKILNQNTILVYPDTQKKLKKYQTLYLRNFYIANGDANEIAQLIQTILKTSDVYVDKRLNFIVMRDTLEVIKLAEKLISSQDLPAPEVMLELEVLEVNSNRLKSLGIRYPDQIGLSVTGASGTAGSLTINDWKGLDSNGISLNISDPSLLFKIKQTATDTKILANPRIRVIDRKSAKIHIGERLPVITTTATANVGTSESITYLDVGLKLDLEPHIYLNNDVSVKLDLEVSRILETQVLISGTTTYRLGTRTASTELRLKDGETGILAGLIRSEERSTKNKVPWISKFPILGSLFTSRDDDALETELVLLITPTVVRNVTKPSIDRIEFFSGTEKRLEVTPSLTPSFGSSTNDSSNNSSLGFE